MVSNLQCVVLAGGLGTRMRPQTERVPKTLLPVGDTPFAHYQLAWMAAHGVAEVVYCIGFLGNQVRAFVGDGGKWGLTVQYVEDGDTLAGTGGALRRAFDACILRDEFLVMYGDSFLPLDFRFLVRDFAEQTLPAMMAVYCNRGRFDTGNVQYEGGRVVLYQKRKPATRGIDLHYIDYGITVLSADIVAEEIPAGAKSDLADMYHRLSVDGRLAGYEVHERFYEIGSPAGLADFSRWAADHTADSWLSLDLSVVEAGSGTAQ
jgi:NDP-sugar pyrophosphorylase family protein